MFYVRSILICICFLLSNNLLSHGFDKHVFIKLANQGYQSIEGICKKSLEKKAYPSVLTYDLTKMIYVNKPIKLIGKAHANCYFKIGFDSQSTSEDILCTPDQQFYVPLLDKWLCVYQLKKGDQLLSSDSSLRSITYLEFIEKALDVYMVKVMDSHNFFVGKYAVLAHNLSLPAHVFAGFTIPFGSVVGGSMGSFLGPVALMGGLVLGGFCGIIVKLFRDDKIPCYKISPYNIPYINAYLDDTNTNVQAPGMPTAEDGYKAPKRNWNGEKIKNPNGPGYGWPDSNGHVWVPVGSTGHGGPHWDVQNPKTGRHRNVLPGGRER